MPELIKSVNLQQLAKLKYQFPKYAVKMATGTGKTWVMHALIIWQLLNARNENQNVSLGRFTKNFLLVAPGLIVYDRLLDAFLGSRKNDEELRNPQTSDFYLNQDLFLPPQYRKEVFSFLQSNIVTKEDGIGQKVTGDGMIAITNWQWFEYQVDNMSIKNETDDQNESLSDMELVNALLPVRPGKAAGNDLSVLDAKGLRGLGLAYLSNLHDLMVINDEAHHIHELKRNGETEEVEWQQGLDLISKNKRDSFYQIDFSATPYDTRGSGKRTRRVFFPHIIVDFDLTTAMELGLVKLLLIDKRQELTNLGNLSYNALRDDEGNVTGLSSGQRMMLRAGLTKLRMLERDFIAIDENKNPKMMVVCQDTAVTPLVEEFLKAEGLSVDDIIVIDSNKQGEVSLEEWLRIKEHLFNIDFHRQPKVIISVLMLREGFDVNNICVLVPLRSSNAPILLEQLIGRGLRLMWRENVYQSIKIEDRRRVLLSHQEPKTFFDTLSIIEHPAFLQFYDEMLNRGLAAIDNGEVGKNGAAGDVITVKLRADYKQYDFQWPVILHDSEQEIDSTPIEINSLEPFTMYPLRLLRKFLSSSGETFVSEEQLTRTVFGRYRVTADLFTSEGYNEYLSKLWRIVTMRCSSVGKKMMPAIQVNAAQNVALIDEYIRTRLFSQPFDPFDGNDWKILLSKDGIVTTHIVEQFAKALYKAQQQLKTIPAEVAHVVFSSVKAIRMRESFSMNVVKSIYPKQSWPSHGGGLERAFMSLLETDAEVEKWLKISEVQHPFACIFYMRKDGLLATYHPDFIVLAKKKIYIVETKGEDKINDSNVQQKQIATTEWIRRINMLPEGERMSCVWEYVLVGGSKFYQLRSGNASFTDICNLCSISYATATGSLFA